MKAVCTVLALCLLAACHKSSNSHLPKSSKVILIEDITDSFAVRPLPEPVLALFNLSKNKSQEAEFNYVLITNKVLNPDQRIHLGNAETTEEANTEDDVHNREKLIKTFCATVRTALVDDPDRFKTEEKSDQSEVFCTISSQLRKLAGSHFDQRTLVVFSDLMENGSSRFNAYGGSAREQLQQEPEAVGKMLQEHCPLPDNLKGIRIVFVFQPRNRQEDEQYIEMMSVYEPLLESRGAKVSFQATATDLKLNDE